MLPRMPGPEPQLFETITRIRHIQQRGASGSGLQEPHAVIFEFAQTTRIRINGDPQPIEFGPNRLAGFSR